MFQEENWRAAGDRRSKSRRSELRTCTEVHDELSMGLGRREKESVAGYRT